MSSFVGQLGNFRKKTIPALHKTIRIIKFEVFYSVVLLSPVDSGRFRGNWQASIGSPVVSVIDRVDPSGQIALTDILSVANGGIDSVAWMTNNLPYAYKLEYDGHSKQAPDGMVRKTAARFEAIIKSAIRKGRL